MSGSLWDNCVDINYTRQAEEDIRKWYNSLMTMIITLDKQSEQFLQQMSLQRGIEPTDMAQRLLRRAIRAAQPKPVYDIEALKAAYAEFAEKDVAFSEATVAHHAELLAYEDRAWTVAK